VPDASTLIEYEKYLGPDKAEHLSRKATANTVWSIVATNKKVYAIKFDSNFAKKHLYTSTKKGDKVLARAQELYVAAGSPKDKSAADFKDAAQKELDQAKFQKQLGHRTQDEQMICANCGHEKKRHFTGSGGPLPPGPKCKHPGGCTCAGWVEKHAYEDKRKGQNKPTENPVAGATTDKNTVIWLNKIDKTAFETVVVESIVARETDLAKAGKAWDSHGEHIDWDFGATNKGCVVYFEVGQPMNLWQQRQGVEVVIKQGPAATVDKPVYVVAHMDKKVI
jgi:hypothetical protein